MMTEAEQPVLVNTQESSVSSGSDSEIKGKRPFDSFFIQLRMWEIKFFMVMN